MMMEVKRTVMMKMSIKENIVKKIRKMLIKGTRRRQ